MALTPAMKFVDQASNCCPQPKSKQLVSLLLSPRLAIPISSLPVTPESIKLGSGLHSRGDSVVRQDQLQHTEEKGVRTLFPLLPTASAFP